MQDSGSLEVSCQARVARKPDAGKQSRNETRSPASTLIPFTTARVSFFDLTWTVSQGDEVREIELEFVRVSPIRSSDFVFF